MTNNFSPAKQENTSYMYIFFSINEIKYALPVYNVIEVLPFCQLQAPQKLQKYTAGLLDYNGILLNVIDLRELLGFEKNNFSINQKLIIIKTDESIFAIIADDIFNIFDVSATSLQIAPHTDKNFVQSIYNTAEYTVSVLNIPAIEYAIKNAHQADDVFFKLPELSEEDTQIAIERALNIKAKNKTYYINKYFDYIKYLTFAVGNTKFCIDISYIEKVIDAQSAEITQIPNKTAHLEGVINFRGTFLTIINFAQFAGLMPINSKNNDGRKIIIISQNDIKIGLLVDTIFEISEITHEELSETNEFSTVYSFIHHQIVKNEDIYFIIDINNLLNDNKLFINE